jgi:hypothetical protein
MSSSSSGSTPTILQARNEFLANGHVQEGAITEAIERSWRRCLASGIDTQSPSNIEVVTAQELARKREQNHQLLALARPEMETLSEQIAHTRNVVILTDDEGLILHSMGSQHLLHEDQRLALTAGTSWNENQRGTNAIGTAIFEQSALTVQGCRALHGIPSLAQLLGSTDFWCGKSIDRNTGCFQRLQRIAAAHTCISEDVSADDRKPAIPRQLPKRCGIALPCAP